MTPADIEQLLVQEPHRVHLQAWHDNDHNSAFKRQKDFCLRMRLAQAGQQRCGTITSRCEDYHYHIMNMIN